MTKKIIVLSLLISFIGRLWSQDAVYIWDGTDVRNGQEVTLTPYLAEGGDGTAIIVCPGGSYFWLDRSREGEVVAKWLQQNGISAFVLHYRTGGFGAYFWHYRRVFNGNQHPDMLNDAQRALEYVRQNSDRYKIDPNRLGIMGFSAGGHLAMSTACFQKKDENPPAFVASIYPVVTMNDPYAHHRSRRALLGEKRKNNQVLRDSLSLEKHIPDNCPPVFIANCIDDDVVDYHNSMLLDAALTDKNIEHKYVQYQTGGHGFGASDDKGSAECHQWKKEFLDWLNVTL